MTNKFDLLIVGAGPAGVSAAIAAYGEGINIAVIDRAEFPREKVCGDFVEARGPKLLEPWMPGLSDELNAFADKVINKSTAFYVNDLEPLRWDWVQRSWTLKRSDFDLILLQRLLRQKEIHFFPRQTLQRIERIDGGISLSTKEGRVFKASMVIGADGAQSQVAKQLANYQVDHQHYGGSVRAYFSGLKGLSIDTNEVYIDRAVVPGYFWLFPLSETTANIGLGMHSRHIVANKVNLKEVFQSFLQKQPRLKEVMAGAQQEGSLKGFGLPFYSKPFSLSGDRFMLCGDAASLVDPINGEGIYQAIYSGLEAGKLLRKLHQRKAGYGASLLAPYAQKVHAKFWKEMRRKAWLVKHFANKPALHHFGAQAILKSRSLQNFVQTKM